MVNSQGSVLRRNENDIERLAMQVRVGLGVGPSDRIAMQPVLEFALDEMVDGAYFEVVADKELDGAEGRTDWAQPRICLSAGTYSRLGQSDPRARMTVAHELGHLLMHTRQPVFHYKTRTKDRTLDPEWQADYFAAALLMPRNAFRKMRSVAQARAAFGVSRQAALRRARDLSIQISDNGPRRSSDKKKGYGMNRTP